MIAPAPVRKTVTVNALPQRAFEVFTQRIGAWWPARYSIGAAPFKEAVLEPRLGGRWYEVAEDGTQCHWGEVLAWEPPQRLLLAWRIGADFKFDPTLLTEVEIRFTPAGETRTRVDLEHRHLERVGEAAETVRRLFEAPEGWGAVLAALAALIDQAQGDPA